MLRYLSHFILIAATSILCGCALIAGTVDSVRRVGLTEGSRKSLFTPSITKFNDAIGWGDIGLALELVNDEYKSELRDSLLRDKDKVKVIETAVDLTEFQNSAYEATVFITMKAYRVPFYIAETFKQKQYWVFSVSDGWKLTKREALAD